MSIIHILIGIPGSGKSTLTDNLTQELKENEFLIISPDRIREIFCEGNRADQSKNWEVWKQAYNLVDFAMRNDWNIIFDSTMMSAAHRVDVIKRAKENDYYIVAHDVQTPWDIACERNKNRKWTVPDYVMENMRNNYEAPTHEEGFDQIITYDENFLKKSVTQA